MEDITAERPGRALRPTRPEMSREQAAGRARTLKRLVAWAAVVAFALLWQAAAHHLTGVTSRAGSTTPKAPAQAPGSSAGFGQAGSSGQGFDFGSSQNVQPFTQSTVS